MPVVWLAIALVMMALPASANEQRCQDLADDGDTGTICICSEPLNTNTMCLGSHGSSCGTPFSSMVNSPGVYNSVDMDDSPNATECSRFGSVPVLSIAAANDPIAEAAAGQPLPSGNSLTYVYHMTGMGSPTTSDSEVKLEVFSLNFTSSATYCVRQYIRYGTDTTEPNDALYGGGGANSQLKIMTIGGVDPNGQHNPHQMDVIGEGAGGFINCRDDSNWFGTPPYFGCQLDSESPSMHIDDCRNNFCRMEVCVDWRGPGANPPHQTRYRGVKLDPGTPTEWNKIGNQGTIARSTWSYSGGFITGWQWYVQNVPNPVDMYASHVMYASKQPYDEDFWIGSAYEVEGPDFTRTCP